MKGNLKFWMPFRLILFLLLVVAGCVTGGEDGQCEADSEKCACRGYDSRAPTLIVASTNGRLGNQMYVLKSLLDLRLSHGFDIFLPSKLRNSLLRFFPAVADEALGVPAGEDVLCGFSDLYAAVE